MMRALMVQVFLLIEKTLLYNAHVSGHENANIQIAFEGYQYEEAHAVYVDPVLDSVIQTKLKDFLKRR